MFFEADGKIRNVQVTLQILAALIEKVPRDLPLYARSVLTVLDIVLRSNEISMVEETIPTFELFCHHQDNATLTADHEYIVQYREIVRAYASFASTEKPLASKIPLSAPMLLRWKIVGLKAIKSVVATEMLAIDGANQLSIIIPVILDNLYAADGENGLTPLQEKARASERLERERLRRRRMSISTVQTVDTLDGTGDPESAVGSAVDADKMAEVEARVLALRCLEKVFSGTNRVQVRLAISLVSSFIVSRRPHRNQSKECDSSGKKNGNWANNLLEFVANWTPVQDRFILLVTLLETLLERPLVDGHLEPQIILASMMDWLLSSPVNLIGLSVIDVLISLLQLIHSLLQLGDGTQKVVLHHPPATIKPLPKIDEAGTPSPMDEKNEKSLVAGPMRHELLELIERCIGNLATHIYYGDQVSDMIRTIASRIRPSPVTGGDSSDNEAATDNALSKSTPRSDNAVDSTFSFPAARVTALKTIKDILVVANLRRSLSGTDQSSRNRVPIQVWEGTHWLLRDPERGVRNAYVEALLAWIQLETNKSDLKVPVDQKQTAKAGHRIVSEPLARKVVSRAPHRQTELTQAAGFLQVLHLTIFDIVSDPSATESDILIFHLLLVNLVEHMGVNAAKHSLPVLMKLQSIGLSSSSSVSPTMSLQIGSLVHGYLMALVEKFNLEGTRVSNEIINEISKRKQRGIWLDKVQLPPRPLNHIPPSLDTQAHQKSLPQPDKSAYSLFTSVDELVAQVENSYNSSYLSPPTSPSNSPGRSFSIPPLGHPNPGPSKLPSSTQLPLSVKEQMLTPWSREACLAAIEEERAKASSLSGSRTATAAFSLRRNNNTVKNKDNEGLVAFPAIHGDRPVSATGPPNGGLNGIKKTRRPSAPEQRLSPATSSRDSTVRVNELRRVLSVVSNKNARQPSPLRGRHRVDSAASSLESMMSDNLSFSDTGTLPAERPFSSRDNLGLPRVSNAQTTRTSDDPRDGSNQDDIPPVPPLPPSLAIPGGFPADSRGPSAVASPSHSPIRSDRPSTAPGRPADTTSKSPGSNAPTVRQSRSLSRKKPGNASLHEKSERTGPELNGVHGGHSYGYSEDMNDIGIAITADTSETYTYTPERGRSSAEWSKQEASRALSLGNSVNVNDLLEGLAIRSGKQGHSPTEMTGAERVPHAAEISTTPTRRGAKSISYSPSSERGSPPHTRKGGLLAPGSAPWKRRTSHIRGGIGPPPY